MGNASNSQPKGKSKGKARWTPTVTVKKLDMPPDIDAFISHAASASTAVIKSSVGYHRPGKAWGGKGGYSEQPAEEASAHQESHNQELQDQKDSNGYVVRPDGVIEFTCLLNVDEELGAGIDVEPTEYGFMVNDVDDDPGQDFQIGDYITSICGDSLEHFAEDEVFGQHFGHHAELVIRRYPSFPSANP